MSHLGTFERAARVKDPRAEPAGWQGPVPVRSEGESGLMMLGRKPESNHVGLASHAEQCAYPANASSTACHRLNTPLCQADLGCAVLWSQGGQTG